MTTSHQPLTWVAVRLYADLADLAGQVERTVPVGAPRSVKDVIESCGVPHTELGLVLVDERPVALTHRITGGERIAAYPPFRTLELGDTVTVVPPEIEPRFVLDVHLGTLARRLRLLGLDVWYRTHADDRELADVAADQRRILLTRDRGLLMRRTITHGYCPRSDDPEQQALEVIDRFGLQDALAPFTRCVRCNGPLLPVDREDVTDRVPARSRAAFDAFARCADCAQVYWPGSHVDAVEGFLVRAAASATPTDGS
jgi:uncharacterized protein